MMGINKINTYQYIKQLISSVLYFSPCSIIRSMLQTKTQPNRNAQQQKQQQQQRQQHDQSSTSLSQKNKLDSHLHYRQDLYIACKMLHCLLPPKMISCDNAPSYLILYTIDFQYQILCVFDDVFELIIKRSTIDSDGNLFQRISPPTSHIISTANKLHMFLNGKLLNEKQSNYLQRRIRSSNSSRINPNNKDTASNDTATKKASSSRTPPQKTKHFFDMKGMRKFIREHIGTGSFENKFNNKKNNSNHTRIHKIDLYTGLIDTDSYDTVSNVVTVYKCYQNKCSKGCNRPKTIEQLSYQ